MIGQFKGRQKTNVYGWVSDLAVARSGFNQIDKLIPRKRATGISIYLRYSALYSRLVNKEAQIILTHSGKNGTIQESNQASGVRKAHYAHYYVQKSSILLTGTGVRKISSVACGFSPTKIHFSDYPKSSISRINEVYVFFNHHYSDILLNKT